MHITFFFLHFFFLFEKGSHYSPGCHGTLYVDLAGLKLKYRRTSASKCQGIEGECHHTQFLPCSDFNLSHEVVLFIDLSQNKTVFICF